MTRVSAALVSVIMPCYNDGRYIKEAIDSLRRQTYSNFELIIVDDGSDDSETVSILSTLNDGKTTVLHTNHLRPAGARNYGIERARGKYILPLDSDDTIEPTYLEKAVNVLETQPDIGVVYCQADLFGEKSGRWELPDYSRRAMLLDNIVLLHQCFTDPTGKLLVASKQIWMLEWKITILAFDFGVGKGNLSDSRGVISLSYQTCLTNNFISRKLSASATDLSTHF